jgi:lipopolysaccharide transport system permease protein
MDTATPLERAHRQTLLIRPPSGWGSLELADLWRFRELLYFFTWRDVKVRYKQTVLGALWAVAQPLVTMVVFTLVFNRAAGIKTDVPYPVFSIASVTLWFYFSNAVTNTANSLVNNSALVSKVYFPRMAVVISPLIAGLVDLAIMLVLAAVVMAYYGVAPGPQVLLVPVFVLLTFVTALGAGLLFSALNAKYRDVRYVVTFLMQILLFATPVGYPASYVHGTYQTLYGINPMAGIMEGFRWALLGAGHPRLGMIAVSVGGALLLLAGGLSYFSRTERSFADVI